MQSRIGLEIIGLILLVLILIILGKHHKETVEKYHKEIQELMSEYRAFATGNNSIKTDVMGAKVALISGEDHLGVNKRLNQEQILLLSKYVQAPIPFVMTIILSSMWVSADLGGK